MSKINIIFLVIIEENYEVSLKDIIQFKNISVLNYNSSEFKKLINYCQQSNIYKQIYRIVIYFFNFLE